METQYKLLPYWTDNASTQPQSSMDTQAERIGEVVLPSLGFSMAALVAPMLNQLSRSDDHRWLTLVCTTAQAKDIAQWLKTTGAVINKLLLLTAEDTIGCLQLSEKVLYAGNSHTVVCWTDSLNPAAISPLEDAARAGDCAGVIIRQRHR
ncbi:SulA-like leucine-rich domain-containing protein [Sansalvadorimonas verongulae]|uniref:SulA-like leucine-rich domain-containing protein n=1 Tax=Sansalvadorimonas verongulae TaxID=2172824 RepID=UPI0012BCCF96|nr:SulA-like leucine-rich domain-containing protein [Sansalvadorimonas verongulae]MTI14315.1 hypothetical protein [Sansalvadorimonas verongulae]